MSGRHGYDDDVGDTSANRYITRTYICIKLDFLMILLFWHQICLIYNLSPYMTDKYEHDKYIIVIQLLKYNKLAHYL